MSSSSPDHQRNPSWQRTVLLATDSSQSIIAEVADGKTNAIAYSAYGEQSAQQEVATGLGFNGQLREARIGWYMLGNGYRAYNPRLMRFHSPDSWSPFGGGGLNPYMYCVGDPVNRSDPTGHRFFLKLLGHAFDFFFGGADVTGPSRRTRHQAAIVENLGGMRPENTGEGAALVTVGAEITATAPRLTRIGSSPGGELHGSAFSSSASTDHKPSGSWIVSPTAQSNRSPSVSAQSSQVPASATSKSSGDRRDSFIGTRTIWQGESPKPIRKDELLLLGGAPSTANTRLVSRTSTNANTPILFTYRNAGANPEGNGWTTDTSFTGYRNTQVFTQRQRYPVINNPSAPDTPSRIRRPS